MKKNRPALLIILITLSLGFFSPISQAQEKEHTYSYKTGEKFARSMSNLSLAVLEIPKNIINRINDSNIFLGTVGGGMQGIINTFGRLGVGVLDLVTLPLPTKPVTNPVHPWQNYFEEDTQYKDIFALDFAGQEHTD